MSWAIPARLVIFLFTVSTFVLFDIFFVPVGETEVYVPKPTQVIKAQKERRERALKQREASAIQAVEVEKALYLLDGTLEGIRLNPNDAQVLSRLEKLRSKVGDSVLSLSSDSSSSSTTADDDTDLGEEEMNGEDGEDGGETETIIKKKPVLSIPAKLPPATSSNNIISLSQRLSLLDDPNSEEWSNLRSTETFESMVNEVEAWITQGKTKRLGFDIFYDPLKGTSELLRSKSKEGASSNGGGEEGKVATEAPKAQPGDAQRRFVARTKLQIPVAMTTFLQNLRSTRTYSHMSKAVDTERKLKSYGYKQSTGGSKIKAIFQGNYGESCPHFDEKQISFCNYYLPTYREQEQQLLLQMHERALKHGTLPLKVEDFFPLTWRLYKQMDRRALRTRTQNESLQFEGGPYVNKFSFSHGAGKPSLTQKMYNQLKKSDESNKRQTEEAKQKMIAQVYCNNPYLFEGKKFIIRTWAIILNVNPMMVLYHDGAILRSVVPYSPFTKRDAHYKRAAHFTNDQSTHKGTLRSSSLYASLGQFQHWLNTQHKETPTFVRDSLRPRLKARMIYALYAMMRPSPRTQADEMDDDTENADSSDATADVVSQRKTVKLPNDVAIVQPVCFDFLLQEGGHHLWMLGAHTSGACAVNLGGDSFRPPWKVAMQTALADKLVDLGEEMLWRKVANVKLESLTDLFTDVPLDALIDETLPGWSYVDEINWYLSGGYVEGGLGGRDVVEAIEESSSHEGKDESNESGNEKEDDAKTGDEDIGIEEEEEAEDM